MATAAGQDCVDAAEDVGRGLDFAAVHGKEYAGGPIEEASADGITDCADDFAGETTHAVGGIVFFGRHGEGNVLQKDGDTLHGFSAKGALRAGKLERICYLVCEGPSGQSV